MNSTRHEDGRMLGLGLLLLAGGGALLVTNVAGLWLAQHVAMLAPIVFGAWPLLLCGTGLALVLHAVASRVTRRRNWEMDHVG